MLNSASPIPLYRQLADLLAAKIGRGEYVPGSRIPSEPQLAGAYGIGRPTVRQAIEALVRKGMLSRRRGSGTYVCEPSREVDLFSLDGTSASFLKKGLSITTQILAPVRLVRINQADDNPFNQRTAYCVSRLTMVDQAPVLVEDTYLDADLFAGLDRIDLQGSSLSTIADQRYYLRPVSGRQSFRIAYAKEEKMRHLQISSDTPVLLVRRYLHFAQRQNGVFAELWCRTDRFVYSQNIGGVQNV